MAETPEQKYNRIAAAVRQTILNEFPNPNRVGCPGEAKLTEVAARRTIVEDDDWQHITHCSPCYAEYLAVKEESRRAGRRAGTLRLIAEPLCHWLSPGLSVMSTWGSQRRRDQSSPVRLRPRLSTFEKAPARAGDQNSPQRDIPMLSCCSATESPSNSSLWKRASRYQIEFRDNNDRLINKAEAQASISGGETSFKTAVDLSRNSAGDYTVGLRQQSFNWVRYRFRLR